MSYLFSERYIIFGMEADSSRYENADGLVGVYRDQDENSSRSLTLDLRKVSFQTFCLQIQEVKADFYSMLNRLWRPWNRCKKGRFVVYNLI